MNVCADCYATTLDRRVEQKAYSPGAVSNAGSHHFLRLSGFSLNCNRMTDSRGKMGQEMKSGDELHNLQPMNRICTPQRVYYDGG
jgi:hypothetical protein